MNAPESKEEPMRKVTLVSLAGSAYQLEEGAHEQISGYLEQASRALAANPDRTEILADLEQAAQILAEMGPVLGTANHAGGAEPAAAAGHAGATQDSTPAGVPGTAAGRKRLMRLPSEGMLGGVCAGLAAYVDVDVVWVRLAFVLLAVFTGVWFLVWLTLLIVMPAARTPEQMASARGEALSAREVMEMARRKSADLGRAAADGLRDAGQNLRETFGPRG
jgi:phage shock protein PspC (stress-responsive transcriptional regulator)